jgi:predicted transcriptional regulator
LKKKQFGDVELEILNIVWKLKKATVSDVHKEILKHRDSAYTSVMTMMQNLAKKGILNFEKVGRSYLYEAAEDPSAVRSNLLERTTDLVFGGSMVTLVQHMVKHEKLSVEELKELENIILNSKKGK